MVQKLIFQTPLNDLTGYEVPAAKQREYLLSGMKEFPEPTEAAKVIWKAVNDERSNMIIP